jgi:tight adherence protein B
MKLSSLALAFLAALTVGGFAWVFVYPLLSGEQKGDKRRVSFVKSGSSSSDSDKGQNSRRDQITESLKDIEARSKKAKKISIATRITQAGLDWSNQKFMVISGALGAIFFLMPLILGAAPITAAGLAFAGGFGLPRWILSFLKKRRETKFRDALPDAVDVIVRGIRAGLPLFDSIRVVAADSPEPLKSEFAAIVETQAIGMPLGEACGRLYERMPMPETNFFGIVISIQQKSGGNLSEALGNLSTVLRDRKKMTAKIQAMSQEAKSSAAIIGSLPPLVGLVIYFVTPGYISLLWSHPTGQILLLGGAFWMSIGIYVMKQMINFDF